MEPYHHILIIVFVSCVLHTDVVALKCYTCHYAYNVKKDANKEFTDGFFNERDPFASRLHKDCGEDKLPSVLMVSCPEPKGKGEGVACWMGVFNSSTIAGVARGCDTTTQDEIKRSKQTLNSCWPAAKTKDDNGIAIDKISCYCNSSDGCTDWSYPGQTPGLSIKRMLNTGNTGTRSGKFISGALLPLKCLTMLAIFLYFT